MGFCSENQLLGSEMVVVITCCLVTFCNCTILFQGKKIRIIGLWFLIQIRVTAQHEMGLEVSNMGERIECF